MSYTSTFHLDAEVPKRPNKYIPGVGERSIHNDPQVTAIRR